MRWPKHQTCPLQTPVFYMKSPVFIPLLFCVFLQPLAGQPRAPKGQTSSCFATCFIPDQYKTETLTIPVYTGSDWSSPFIEKVELPLGACRLVKKTNGEISSYCLEYASDTTNRRFWRVTDTTQVKQFALRTVVVGKTLVKQGGYSEWREVLCDNRVAPQVALQIRTSLKALGFDPGTGNTIDAALKAALVRFQKDRGLPIGNLDFETLSALGITY